MPNERKSSEDLIREARDRLGEPAETFEEPTQSPEQPAFETPLSETPVQALDTEEPTAHVYRSQIPDPVTEQVPVSPIEYSKPANPWIPRLIGWGVIAVIGLGIAFFTSLDDASRDNSGEIVEAGDLDVMTIQEGDCFDDPDATDVVFSLDAIPCTQPHDNEVFAVASIVGVWDDYPGQSAVDGYAYEQCSGGLFDDFVGTAYFDSTLDVFTLTPTPESWAQGDREIVCALYRLDFQKLTGTARNSGI